MSKFGCTILMSASLILLVLFTSQTAMKGHNLPAALSATASDPQTVKVLIDDFTPQPLQGDQFWSYNRLEGDRGQIDGWWDPICGCAHPGGGHLSWGRGIVTATITQTQGTEAWVGVFTSLNHPIRENIPLNFSAIFPSQILPQYQGRVTELLVLIRDGHGTFCAELQAPNLSFPWRECLSLAGGQQNLQFSLPTLGEIRNLNWIVKGHLGDYAVVDQVSLVVEVPQLSAPERAFLSSYAMLLSNWIPATGLTRDRANFPAGDFDNVSASGMQAAAAVTAWKFGMISKPAAAEIVTRTTQGLMSLPRCMGLWPHFVTNGQIVTDTEWSSLDTILTVVPLLEAQEVLGLDTARTEQVLTTIDWMGLITPDGRISHGFNYTCTKALENSWYDFGTETWLANFGYAAATGNVASMDTISPTFNGSGFIDELAWLLVPAPRRDRWGIDWSVYRQQAAERQLDYYRNQPCYSGPPRLFGLSAAEVPDPSSVQPSQLYQAFGVGGKIPPNDGTSLLGHAVIVPHYVALIASLRPNEASAIWEWIEGKRLFSPLNNVESFMFIDEPTCQQVVWNDLKGSWNLSLQTLGWGRLLAGNDNPLYTGLWANDLLRRGYMVMWGPAYRIFLPTITK
jgi:hypothetical protein